MKIEDLKIGLLYRMVPSGITFFNDCEACLAHYNHHGFDFSFTETGFPVSGEFDISPKLFWMPNEYDVYDPITVLLVDCKRIYRSSIHQRILGKPERYCALQFLKDEKVYWSILSEDELHKMTIIESENI